MGHSFLGGHAKILQTKALSGRRCQTQSTSLLKRLRAAGAVRYLEGVCPHHDGWRLLLGRVVLSSLLVGSGALVPIGRAEGWKGLPPFNDQPNRLSRHPPPDGSVRILWTNGKTMTYRIEKEGFPYSTCQDTLGGVWSGKVFV